MTSNLSAFAYIPERAPAVPALWNDIFSTLSSNIAAIASPLTIGPPSGDTLSISTNLEVVGGGHFQHLSIGSTPPSYLTTAAVTIEVNSAYSDYLYLVDSSAQKSSYIIGSRAGGLADGLNIWDVSAGTMIASFSKQSVRFWQKVVGPVLDVSGAVFNVLSYGATNDGVTDDTAAINLAIATCAAAGGGVVFFPGSRSTLSYYKVTSSLTISASNIRFQGTGWNMSASPTAPPSFIRGPAMTTPVVTTPSGTTIFGLSIIDLGFSGNGATSASMGLVVSQANEVYLERCFFDAFGGSAISLGASVIGATLNNMWATNCLQAIPIAKTGVFDLRATDIRAYSCFATVGKFGMGSIGNGFQYGWAIRSSPGMFYGCMGDQCHHGWLVEGGAGNNAFLGCRAYQNQGSGFVVTQGPANRFVGCMVLGGGQDADNTYSGFSVTGYSNMFTSCFVDGQSTDTVLMAHGFADSNSNGQLDSTGNRYVGNFIGANMRGSLYSMTGTSPYRIAQPRSMSSDRGDSTVTLLAGIDQDTQLFNTVLTSTRTVNVSTTGAWKGAQFRVVRTANATGAPVLAVSGATLLPGQFTDIEFTGTAWQRCATGIGDGRVIYGSSVSGSFTVNAGNLTLSGDGLGRLISGANPFDRLQMSGGGHWDYTADPTLKFRALPDNDSVATNWLTVTRSGNTHRIDLPNSGISINGPSSVTSGSALLPSMTFLSENSLGWYSSGASTMALSYGTIDLTASGAMTSIASLKIKSGTNNSCGTAVLGSNGSVNVANTYVKTGDLIFLTDQTPGGTLGDLEILGIRNSSGFTIASTGLTDTSTVAWLIVRPG